MLASFARLRRRLGTWAVGQLLAIPLILIVLPILQNRLSFALVAGSNLVIALIYTRVVRSFLLAHLRATGRILRIIWIALVGAIVLRFVGVAAQVPYFWLGFHLFGAFYVSASFWVWSAPDHALRRYRYGIRDLRDSAGQSD